MTPIPLLSLSEIEDEYIRKNFERELQFFRDETPLLGFKHFELSLDTSQTAGTFQHNLGFTPTDLIQTFLSGGQITWNYGNFNGTTLEYTVTVTTPGTPVLVRFFLGAYNSSP